MILFLIYEGLTYLYWSLYIYRHGRGRRRYRQLLQDIPNQHIHDGNGRRRLLAKRSVGPPC